MDENAVFEVFYNRGTNEDGLVSDSPAWSQEAHALTRSYFESRHGVQWIAAAFPHANGRVIRVTSSDSDWTTFEVRFRIDDAVEEVVRRLGVMMSPEELLWLSAVLVSVDAVEARNPRREILRHQVSADALEAKRSSS